MSNVGNLKIQKKLQLAYILLDLDAAIIEHSTPCLIACTVPTSLDGRITKVKLGPLGVT